MGQHLHSKVIKTTVFVRAKVRQLDRTLLSDDWQGLKRVQKQSTESDRDLVPDEVR